MKSRKKSFISMIAIVFLTAAATLLLPVSPLYCAPLSLPNVSLNIGGAADQPGQMSGLLQLMIFLTLLTLAPAILLMVTSFTRIVVVLSLVRNALGRSRCRPTRSSSAWPSS